MTIKQELEHIADRLAEFAEKLPDEEARMVRNASYELENVRTSKAVAELMTAAAHQFGVVGPVASEVIREKRRLAA